MSINLTTAIVMTSVNFPTTELLAYTAIPGCTVYMAGDQRTPHSAYEGIPNLVYLHPDKQHEMYPGLSNLIGWNCIQRRYAAVLAAYNNGHEVFGFADDDNRPYANWANHSGLLSSESLGVEADNYMDPSGVFDPYSVTSCNSLWHRGYPLKLVPSRQPLYMGKIAMKPLVFERLVDGDPDIDAVARLPFRPTVRFSSPEFYTTRDIVPFNSQNTLVSRQVIPYYLNLPGVGRFDDIFGAYLLQRLAPFMKPYALFGKATAYQQRSPQDLVRNLEMETFGYRHTDEMINAPLEQLRNILPACTIKAYKLWNEYFGVTTEL